MAAESSRQIEELWTNLQNFKTFKGKFTQRVKNLKMPQFRAKQTQGLAWLQKPNLFRWQLNEPDNQLIVSDGQFVWLYDKDLKQVTRRPYQTHQRDIANLLLSGHVDELKAMYQVKIMPVTKQTTIQEFVLEPKAKDSMVRTVELSFTRGALQRLKIIDAMGKQTTFTFRSVIVNQPLNQQLFHFKVPKGVDLIKEQTQNS